jgi:hypothetical protein
MLKKHHPTKITGISLPEYRERPKPDMLARSYTTGYVNCT